MAIERVVVEYCGEEHSLLPGVSIVLGRSADVVIDEDNDFLHRRFLEINVLDELCWLRNLGAQLTATVVDDASRLQAWLAPGARLPLVAERYHVRFTAGPTTYEFSITVHGASFQGDAIESSDGSSTETIRAIPLTTDQKLLIIALAEPLLRQEGRGNAAVPSSAQAAQRLNWTITKFNRKLDNVCEKLTRSGVRGLHGDPGALAVNRRARLVEYAVATGVVVPRDLAQLDEPHSDGDD